MNNTTLKIIAIISMLIDHIGAILFPEITVLRIIGRLAFPIFAFLVAQGYEHTSDKKKYILRMFIFALISEIPFDVGFFGQYFYFGHQNVLVTFTLALLILTIKDNEKYSPLIKNLLTLFLAGLSIIINSDYSIYGIIMVLAFYYYRKNLKIAFIIVAAVNVYLGLSYSGIFRGAFNPRYVTQAFAVFGLIPIMLYNGKRGAKIKYLFYAFYPLHILILGIIDRF